MYVVSATSVPQFRAIIGTTVKGSELIFKMMQGREKRKEKRQGENRGKGFLPWKSKYPNIIVFESVTSSTEILNRPQTTLIIKIILEG